MTVFYWAAGIIALALMIYLFIAMLFPEKF
jgi:K+-transporting ATPase KdpF subunit